MKNLDPNSHDKYRLKKIKISIQIEKFRGFQRKFSNVFNNNAADSTEVFKPDSFFVIKYANYRFLKKQICISKDWNDNQEKYSYSYKTNSFVSKITNKTKRNLEKTTKIILNFKNKKQKSSNNSWRAKKEIQFKQFQVSNQPPNRFKNKPLQASMNFSNFHGTLQFNKKLEPLACEDSFKLLKSHFFPKIIPTTNRSAPKFKLTIKEIYRNSNKNKADNDFRSNQKTRMKNDQSQFPNLSSGSQLNERFQTDKSSPFRRHNNQNFPTILTFKPANSKTSNLELKNQNDKSIKDQENIIINPDGSVADKVAKIDVSLLKLENKLLENSVFVTKNETSYFVQNQDGKFGEHSSTDKNSFLQNNQDGKFVEYSSTDKNSFQQHSLADFQTFIKNKDGSFSEAILQDRSALAKQSENINPRVVSENVEENVVTYIKNDDETVSKVISTTIKKGDFTFENEYLGVPEATYVKNEDGIYRELNIKNKQDQFNLSEHSIEIVSGRNIKNSTQNEFEHKNNDGTFREINFEIKPKTYNSKTLVEGNLKGSTSTDLYTKDDRTLKEMNFENKSHQNGLINDATKEEINFDRLTLIDPVSENMDLSNPYILDATHQTSTYTNYSIDNKNRFDQNMKNRAPIYPFIKIEDVTFEDISFKNASVDNVNFIRKNMKSDSYFKNEDRTIKEINFEYKPDEFNSMNLNEGNVGSLVWSDGFVRKDDRTSREENFINKTNVYGAPIATYARSPSGTFTEVLSKNKHENFLKGTKILSEENTTDKGSHVTYIEKEDTKFSGILTPIKTAENYLLDNDNINKKNVENKTSVTENIKNEVGTVSKNVSMTKPAEKYLLDNENIIKKHLENKTHITEYIRNDDGIVLKNVSPTKSADNYLLHNENITKKPLENKTAITDNIINEDKKSFKNVSQTKPGENYILDNENVSKKNLENKTPTVKYTKNEDGNSSKIHSTHKSNQILPSKKKENISEENLEDTVSPFKYIENEDGTFSEMVFHGEQILDISLVNKNMVSENVKILSQVTEFVVKEKEEHSKVFQGLEESSSTAIENNDLNLIKVEYENLYESSEESDILEIISSIQKVQNPLSENEVLLFNFKATVDDANYTLYKKGEELTSSNFTNENIQLYKEIQESQSVQNANENQIFWTNTDKTTEKPIIVTGCLNDNTNIDNGNMTDTKLSKKRDLQQESLVKRISFTRYEHKSSGLNCQSSKNELENHQKETMLIPGQKIIKMNTKSEDQLVVKEAEKKLPYNDKNSDCVLKRLSIQYSDPKLSGNFRAPSNEGEYFGGENLRKNSFKENDADNQSTKAKMETQYQNASYIKKLMDSSHDTEQESQESKTLTGHSESTDLASFYGSGTHLFNPEHSPFTPLDNSKIQKFPILENSKETKTDYSTESNDYFIVNTRPSGYLTDKSSSASFYGSGSLNGIKKDLYNIEKNSNDYLFTINSQGLESMKIKTVDIHFDTVITHSPKYETDNFDIDQIAFLDTFKSPNFEKILFDEKELEMKRTVLESLSVVRSIEPINVSLMQSLLPENALDMRPPDNPPDIIKTIESETIKSTNIPPNHHENIVQVIEKTKNILLTESPELSDFYDVDPCSDVSLSLIQMNQLTCQSNVNQNNKYLKKCSNEILVGTEPSDLQIVTKRKYIFPIETYKKLNNRFFTYKFIISLSTTISFHKMTLIKFPVNSVHKRKADFAKGQHKIYSNITKMLTSSHEHIIDRRKRGKLNHTRKESNLPGASQS